MAPPLTADAFAAAAGVSRETTDRLAVYLDLLRRWQRAINLVGRSTLDDPWRRHVLDSAQVWPHLPSGCRRLVDLGSGAGLPGLVLAVLGVPEVHLIESDRRKAQFLREAARATGVSVTVHAARIEEVPGFSADAVTARALAPLPALLGHAERFVGPATRLLFLKGARAEAELTEAELTWHMKTRRQPSVTDPAAVLLILEEPARAR